MNVYGSYSSVTEQFTFSTAPDSSSVSASVYYEYDTLLLEDMSVNMISSTVYSVNIPDEITNSFGVYKIKWIYQISGVEYYAYSEFKIEDKYVNLQDFLNNYPDYELPEFISKFSSAEKTARRIIDTYTGQNFQSVLNKTKQYDGNGRNKIYLQNRLISYSSVFIDESDYTEKVSLDLRSRYYIKLIEQYPYPDSRRDDLLPATFPKKTVVKVTGDWGWLSVPWEIEQAAEILIQDFLDDVRREHHTYGINRLDQANNRLLFDKSMLNSTGNIDVDTLLMDYTLWTMDYVV